LVDACDVVDDGGKAEPDQDDRDQHVVGVRDKDHSGRSS